MFSTSVAQLVDGVGRRLSERGRDSLRLELAGRLVILRGAETRERSALVQAGGAVFELRASAGEVGLRVEVEVLPARDPSIWAAMTFHPRRPRESADAAWDGSRLLGTVSAGHPLRARELVAACERGAASEGVSVRLAPMPLPAYFGLILRARGHEPADWFALGQAWAGIERLAQRCGWTAHLRVPADGSPPLPGAPLGARVEVWVLRRAGAVSAGGAEVGTDEWMGF